MSFAKLPNEIIYQILREAVCIRSTKRAQRLRFVSRVWKAAVDEAIVRLGEFVSDRSGYDHAPYWQEFTLRAALRLGPRRPGPVEVLRGEWEPQTLRRIRDVAERVARYAHPDTYSEDMLKEYIVEISKMSQMRDARIIDRVVPQGDPWCIPTFLSGFDIAGERDHRLLLAAAAWTNQVGLVKELLQSWPFAPFVPNLFDVAFRFLDFALARAAYRGHNETIRVLLDTIGELGREFSIHGDRSLTAERTAEKIEFKPAKTVLRYASRGNSVSAIKLFARPEKGGRVLVYAVFDTTSLEIFQTLYPWAKNHLDTTDPTDAYYRHTIEHTTGRLMQSAARRGAVPILDYLFRQLYPDSVSWCADSPPPKRLGADSMLEAAARHGRVEAVVYLLQKGVPVSFTALEAAVQYGNPTIVQLLVGHGVPVEDTDALAQAVVKEDDKMLQILLDACAARIDIEYKGNLVGLAREQGLESMEKLLRELWEK